jgi:hypothetical protein
VIVYIFFQLIDPKNILGTIQVFLCERRECISSTDINDTGLLIRDIDYSKPNKIMKDLHFNDREDIHYKICE